MIKKILTILMLNLVCFSATAYENGCTYTWDDNVKDWIVSCSQ